VALSDEYNDEYKMGSGEVKRGVDVGRRFLNPGARSHIVLAACGRGESALERTGQAGGGVFTSALLDLLKKRGDDMLTYAQLVAALGTLAK
jgi:hypothetical protein